MHLLKFSIFVFIICNHVISFEGKKCFESNFDVTVKHKGWPFGLTENVIVVRKDKCDLTFSHERMKYLKSYWHLDVCREPVHVKKGSGTVEVIKRISNCSKSSDDSFCNEMTKLKGIIQDDGLIFAKGSKEDLNSEHGRVYCAYRLMKAYVGGKVLSPDSIKGSDFTSESSSTLSDVQSSEEKVAPRPIMDDIGTMEVTSEEEESNVEEEKSSSTGSF